MDYKEYLQKNQDKETEIQRKRTNNRKKTFLDLPVFFDQREIDQQKAVYLNGGDFAELIKNDQG